MLLSAERILYSSLCLLMFLFRHNETLDTKRSITWFTHQSCKVHRQTASKNRERIYRDEIPGSIHLSTCCRIQRKFQGPPHRPYGGRINIEGIQGPSHCPEQRRINKQEKPGSFPLSTSRKGKYKRKSRVCPQGPHQGRINKEKNPGSVPPSTSRKDK